jgi:hypothetical protein
MAQKLVSGDLVLVSGGDHGVWIGRIVDSNKDEFNRSRLEWLAAKVVSGTHLSLSCYSPTWYEENLWPDSILAVVTSQAEIRAKSWMLPKSCVEEVEAFVAQTTTPDLDIVIERQKIRTRVTSRLQKCENARQEVWSMQNINTTQHQTIQTIQTMNHTYHMNQRYHMNHTNHPNHI